MKNHIHLAYPDHIWCLQLAFHENNIKDKTNLFSTLWFKIFDVIWALQMKKDSINVVWRFKSSVQKHLRMKHEVQNILNLDN